MILAPEEEIAPRPVPEPRPALPEEARLDYRKNLAEEQSSRRENRSIHEPEPGRRSRCSLINKCILKGCQPLAGG
jgi:hypothetical protein